MARSTLEILAEFENKFAQKLPVALESFYQALGEGERSLDLYTDLARAELYLKKWQPNRLSEMIAFADSLGGLGEKLATLLEGVYLDQVECGQSPSLTEFSSFDLSKVCLRAASDPLALGEMCSSYQIVRRIASGGFGVVYEGETASGDSVAIKSPFVTSSPAKSELAKKLLKAEAKAANQLGGHRFPKFIEWIEDHNGHACLVTELIVGESLKDRIKAKSLEPDTAIGIAIDVAMALYCAHCKRIIHRDVKPQNVMIRENGRAVLIDFGFAVDDEELIALEGQIAGTLGHQSPDAILGNLPDMDARSDVWAIGPLLHECITGEAMFSPSAREDALTDAIVAAVLPKNSNNIPDEIQAIIHRCMQANPIGRYDTALDVVRDLKKILRPAESIPAADRTPLLSFRIGRELGEAQCHIDAFAKLVRIGFESPEIRQHCVGALFMVSEEIRHCRIYLTKEPFNLATWPEFDHDSISILFYRGGGSKDNTYLDAVTDAANAGVNWVDSMVIKLQDFLANQPIATRALFELGFVATLAKSEEKRSLDIARLATLAELPADIWTQYSDYLQEPASSKFVNDELRRFAKRVERHYLYPNADSPCSPDPQSF